MKEKKKEYQKLESDWLGASDIVNQVGGQYIIKEEEMESALKEVFEEIGDREKQY
jgi:hypothetical protein